MQPNKGNSSATHQMLRVMLGLFFLLMLSYQSSAQSFSIDHQATKNNIYQNETAEFLLTITNEDPDAEAFTLSFTNDPRWSIQTWPLVDYISGVTVLEGKTHQTRVMIRPTQTMPVGLYLLEVFLKSKETGEVVKDTLDINIKSQEGVIKEYLPSVTLDIRMPDKVDPRDEFTVKVFLKNRNPLEIEEMTISVASPLFTRERVVSLAPLEEKEEDFSVELDPLEEPATYSLTSKLTILSANRTFTVEGTPVEFEIGTYSTLDKDSVKEEGFLYTHETITIVNRGNYVKDAVMKKETFFLKTLFTLATPDPVRVTEDGKKYLKWEISLQPDETFIIDITNDYRPLFYLGIVFIVVVLLYFVLRSPVVVKKGITKKVRTEGGISEIKVLLHVKNRTGKEVEYVKVIDRVPHLVEVGKEIQLGTIPPTSINRRGGAKGTLLIWELESLEPYEERIITYTIHSTLSILGGFNLPSAIIKFRKGRRQLIVKSNRYQLKG
ncbi:hypothetical protein HYW21_08330 [Candidatus Woesearchaeota archaeon]|nr:hypothetical protein [Candidatus Woesearchaeota archaeon]